MGLSPHSVKRFAGLFASTNPYGGVREGAMSVADNCSLRNNDVLEPRRGFKASASCAAPINALTFKQGVAVAITYDNPGAGITGALRKYDPVADAWTTLPMNPGALTIDRPGSLSGVDTRFVSAQKAIYFQSKYGLTKIEDIASGVCRCALTSPLPAGAGSLAGLYGATGATILTGAGNNWLANGNTVAYRFTVCRFGANGELIESTPSDRLVFTNSSGSAGRPQIDGTNGPLNSPDTFIRIYRSVQAAGTPSDEMFLVAERIVVSIVGAMSNGFEDVGIFSPSHDDQTSDSALSVPLYTNANTGGTLAVANEQAPLSVDLAWFRGRLYGLNTSVRQNITVRIIGTGTGGINAGDYFYLGGHKIVFSTDNMDLLGRSYLITIYTAGTVSANIELTSRNMVQAVGYNFDPSPHLASPAAGAPLYTEIIANTPTVGGAGGADSGFMILRSVLPGTPPFIFQTGGTNGWDRDYTAGLASSNNAQAAGISWSNINEPEGFPLANNTLIGDPTAAGQRCIALKEALFVFKQDGLWKLTDDGSSLGPLIQPVDPTIRLVAPETAVALDNFILALCDQGVVLISETGAVVNITHRQIERELFALMARVGSDTLANLAFGVAYPPEHTYILSIPESSNATACTRQYVYNLETQTWTSWTVPGVLCGSVNPDTGQLYFGRTDGTIWIERKNYDSTDYQDPGFTIAFPMPVHTNLAFQSQTIGTAPWQTQITGTALPITVTANAAVAPDGTTTATRIQYNRGAGNTLTDLARVFQVVNGLSAGQVHCYSVWIKTADGTTQNISIEEHSGSFKVVQATGVWQRFFTTATPAVTPENSCYIGTRGTYGTDSVLDVHVWGAQLEVGSTPGDYIPTIGAAQTMGSLSQSLVFPGDLRTSQTTPFAVGDLIQQPNSGVFGKFLQRRVVAVTYSSAADQTTVTLDAAPATVWDDTPLTVVRAIQCKPTFLPFNADEPLQDKEWGDAYLSFRYCDLDFATVGWTSEKYQMPTGTNPASERINNADGSAAPIQLQGWGVSSWGGSVWGRQTKDVVLKATLPEEVGGYSAQLTLGLTLPCGLARFELSAIDVKISGETTQTTR